jgi:hypothetical protein
LVEQTLQCVGRRFPGGAGRDISGSRKHIVRIFAVYLLDQSVDRINLVLGIAIRVVFCTCDILLGLAYPLGDRCLGLSNGICNILIPGDGFDEVVLHRGQLVDDLAEFATCGFRRAALPDTAAEDLGLLMLEPL